MKHIVWKNMKLGTCKIHSNKTLFILTFNCDFKKVCKFVENARNGTVKCSFTVVLMFSRIVVPLSPGSSTEIKMIKHLFSLVCLTLTIKNCNSLKNQETPAHPTHKTQPFSTKVMSPSLAGFQCLQVLSDQENRIHFSYEGTHSGVQSCNVCD